MYVHVRIVCFLRSTKLSRPFSPTSLFSDPVLSLVHFILHREFLPLIQAEMKTSQQQEHFVTKPPDGRCMPCFNCVPIIGDRKEGGNCLICGCGGELCLACGTKWKTCQCPWLDAEDTRRIEGLEAHKSSRWESRESTIRLVLHLLSEPHFLGLCDCDEDTLNKLSDSIRSDDPRELHQQSPASFQALANAKISQQSLVSLPASSTWTPESHFSTRSRSLPNEISSQQGQ